MQGKGIRYWWYLCSSRIVLILSYFNLCVTSPRLAAWCDFAVGPHRVKRVSLQSAVCPYSIPRAVPFVTQTERVHLSFPIYATLFSPSVERRDGWQLFVDSMPRLISSACWLGRQRSVTSEVSSPRVSASDLASDISAQLVFVRQVRQTEAQRSSEETLFTHWYNRLLFGGS